MVKKAKKTISIILLVVLLVYLPVFLGGCVSDWTYELPNDYCISNNARCYNSLDKITVRTKNGFSSHVIVESYIHEFAYNEQHVAVKQFDPLTIDFENFI